MNITRRDVLRRIAGIATAASIWASTVFVLDDDLPSVVGGRQASNNGRRNGGTAPGRSNRTEDGTSMQPSTTGSGAETGSTSDTTIQPAESTTVSTITDESTTTHDHGAPTTTAPQVASLDLSGRIGPVQIPAGAVATIVGDVTLAGDLVVEGTLTGVDSFTLEGNGFQIEVRNGGRVDFRGKKKTGWARVGESVDGWSKGDRLGIAPTASGDFSVRAGTWSGSWSGVSSPGAVRLLDGRTLQPEVANLSRSITLRGLSRIMFHEGAGQSQLRHISVQNVGKEQLGFYPIHFHLNGGTTHGSVVEGVVVEASVNRAFVPHGSSGITFRDCVAVEILRSPYWWDLEDRTDGAVYSHCLALGVRGSRRDPVDWHRLTGFMMHDRSAGGVAVNCAAAAIGGGGSDVAGFFWPGGSPITEWDFRNNVAHNIDGHGLGVWQNSDEPHFVVDSVVYRCSKWGSDHGAYRNGYLYARNIMQECGFGAVNLHSNSKAPGNPQQQTFEDLITDGILRIENHNLPQEAPTVHRRCTYRQVLYNETGENPSTQVFEDCGLTPDHFRIESIHAGSRIEIFQGGNLMAIYGDGAWT